MSKGWDGVDRRKSQKRNVNYESLSERDLLISLHSNLNNHIDTFEKHEEDDDTKFSGIEKNLNLLNAGYYVFIGAFLIIELLIRK